MKFGTVLFFNADRSKFFDPNMLRFETFFNFNGLCEIFFMGSCPFAFKQCGGHDMRADYF